MDINYLIIPLLILLGLIIFFLYDFIESKLKNKFHKWISDKVYNEYVTKKNKKLKTRYNILSWIDYIIRDNGIMGRIIMVFIMLILIVLISKIITSIINLF